MPGNNDVTTHFGADISELKKAMQEAKRAVAIADSEFKAASSSMDKWSASSDGLEAKLKQLDSNLKSNKVILESLEEQYRQVKEEQGENSKAAQDLLVKVNEQKAVVGKTEKELKHYTKALDDLEEESDDAADATKDLGDSAEDAGDGFTTLKGTIATFAGNVLTSLVGSIKDAVGSLVGLADETREYRTELAKMDAAASVAGASADYIKDKWHDMGAVLGDEGAVAEGLNNLMAAGYTTQTSMDEITKYLEGAAIKWKDTLKFEGLADGLQETFAVGEAAGSFTEMLERSGVDIEKFNEGLGKCKTSVEQQNYVMQQLSTLGLAEVSDAYREQNKDLIAANKANSEYADTMAGIGATIEPVTTAVKKGFTELIQKAMELVGDVDISAFVSKIEEGFKILSDEVLPAVKDGLGWIADNKNLILAAITGIAGGFVAFKAASVIASAVGWVKGLGTGLTVLKGIMAALGGPVTIAVTIIGALVAAFITLWNTSDGFRAFWINLWENVKAACGKAKDWISQKIAVISDFFTNTLPEAINKAIEWFSQLPGEILQRLKEALAYVSDWATNTKNQAKEAGSQFLEKLVTFFAQLPGKAHKWLTDTITRVTEWAATMKEEAQRAAQNFVYDFMKFFSDVYWQIHYQLFLVQKRVKEWALEMAEKAYDAAYNFVYNVKKFMLQLPEMVWTWLQNVVSNVVTWGANMIANGKTVATNFINSVVNLIKELPQNVWTWLQNVISKVTSWGSSMAEKGRQAAQELVNTVVNKVKELPGKMASIGEDVVRGIWNGINNMGSWIENKIRGFVGDVEQWLKDWFGIASPSKLMADEIGRWIPAGIAVGIDKNAKSVLSSVKDLTANTVGAARSGLSGIGKTTPAMATAGSVGGAGGVVNNFYQTINSPKQLKRLDVYRNTKNLLGYAGGAR